MILMGSGSAVAHHYPPSDHYANWTIYEGGDGNMEITEDDLDPNGGVTLQVFVEVIPGTDWFCSQPFYNPPELYDSEGRTNQYQSSNPNEDYFQESCALEDSWFPIFKDRTNNMAADSSVCLLNIGFVWLNQYNEEENTGTYRWETSHDLWVMDSHHESSFGGTDQACDYAEEGIPAMAILGAAGTGIAILGGIFYWRKKAE